MHLIIDLEATCWEVPKVPDLNEIIDIGIVVCNDLYEILDTWESLVRPTINPKLSPFCKKLTAITQDQIDKADTLDLVFKNFSQWFMMKFNLDHQVISWHTWGTWDLKCLKNDCIRNLIQFPFGEHVDLKEKYTKKRSLTSGKNGLQTALEQEKFEPSTHTHRGLSDALGAAKIAKLLFDQENTETIIIY